jgi:hypothetical protein
MGTQYDKSNFDQQVKCVCHSLQLLEELKHWAIVSRLCISVSYAMMEIGNDVHCILHLHKHVIEKLLSLVMLKSLEEQDKTKAARLRHGKNVKVVEWTCFWKSR